eukprot:6692662-Pyramimonas_sp.AAC.1
MHVATNLSAIDFTANPAVATPKTTANSGGRCERQAFADPEPERRRRDTVSTTNCTWPQYVASTL